MAEKVEKSEYAVESSDSEIGRPAARDEEDAARKALLQSFTPEEDRIVRRKIDWRFLPLIGMMYLVKTVGSFFSLSGDR